MEILALEGEMIAPGALVRIPLNGSTFCMFFKQIVFEWPQNAALLLDYWLAVSLALLVLAK